MTIDGGHVATLFLLMMRTAGFIVTAPLFGHKSIPPVVRGGLAAVLAIAISANATIAPTAAPLPLAIPIELMIGAGLGFVLSLGFQAVELGGRMLALQMGLSLGSVLSPISREASTPLDPFFAALAVLVFLAMNLHTAIVRVLAQSLQTFPLGGAWPSDFFLFVGQMTALIIELGIRIAMPLTLSLLLTELAVALIARSIPQINVFILGLPLKLVVGMAVLAAALPALVSGTGQIYNFIISAAMRGSVS